MSIFNKNNRKDFLTFPALGVGMQGETLLTTAQILNLFLPQIDFGWSLENCKQPLFFYIMFRTLGTATRRFPRLASSRGVVRRNFALV